jgi:hypothetical protein
VRVLVKETDMTGWICLPDDSLSAIPLALDVEVAVIAIGGGSAEGGIDVDLADTGSSG